MSATSTVYLSGELVPFTGVYEVVATQQKKRQTATQPSIRELEAGELFPDYDGRAVSWHPLSEPSGPTRSRVHITS